jgi:Tol biopolymer transport system component
MSRLRLLGIFGIAAAITFGLLLVVSTPVVRVTDALPTPFPTQPLYLSPTAPSLQPQCALTGQHYELRVKMPDTNQPSPYTTYPSPDGQYTFYKDGDDLYVRQDKGHTVRLGSDQPYGDIEGRVFWSPDSRSILLSPGTDNHPVIYDISAGPAIILSAITDPTGFHDWSPDGEHFLYYDDSSPTMSIWSAKTGTPVYTTRGYSDLLRWSPDGRWLAYVWGDNANLPYTQNLSIASADGMTAHDYMLTASDPYSAGSPAYALQWSPDSRFVAFHAAFQNGQIYQRLVIVSSIGSRLLNAPEPVFVTAPLTPTSPDISAILQLDHWSADGQRYSYVDLSGAGHFELAAYSPATGKIESLAPNLYKPPFYSPSGGQIGLYTRTSGTYAVRLTDADSANPVTLVKNATDTGDPDWSRDEKWVAVVWAERQGKARNVHLTWMHPDGSGWHTANAYYKDIRDLRWMSSGRLAYVARRNTTTYSVEMADLMTGGVQILAEGLRQVTAPVQDGDTLSFWWQGVDGTFGKDAYRADGTLLYHSVAAGDFNRPRDEFWSPDGKVLALKIGSPPGQGPRDQMLVLDYADGRPPIIVRAGLDGLDVPLWSPDSRMAAFAQWVRGDGINPSPPGLAVISANGQTLWYDDDFPVGTPLEWVACGA